MKTIKASVVIFDLTEKLPFGWVMEVDVTERTGSGADDAYIDHSALKFYC